MKLFLLGLMTAIIDIALFVAALKSNESVDYFTGLLAVGSIVVLLNLFVLGQIWQAMMDESEELDDWDNEDRKH